MHLPFLVSAQHNFFSYLWGGELRNERTWFWWAAPRYNSCLAAHGSLFFSIEGKEGGNRLWINRRLIVPWLTGVCWSWDSVDETWIPFPSCVSSYHCREVCSGSPLKDNLCDPGLRYILLVAVFKELLNQEPGFNIEDAPEKIWKRLIDGGTLSSFSLSLRKSKA